jgi:hypothetical protein
MTEPVGNVNTAGGVDIAIGTTVVCTTLAQYEADTYVSIGEVEDGGQVGDEAASVPFTSLANSRTQKYKGPYDAGTMAVVCGSVTNDPGQIALTEAVATKFNYNFCVTLADPVTLTGEPTTLYFSAQVMSERRNIGTASNIIKRTFNLGINTAITEVAPT